MSGLIDDLLDVLRQQQLIKNVRIVSYDETPAGKVELKIRCRLVKNYQLQVWLHLEPAFQDYAYQLFTNRPILRWDNAPHYPHIPTAPHHFHDEQGKVSESPLTGNLLNDLETVLSAISQWLS